MRYANLLIAAVMLAAGPGCSGGGGTPDDVLSDNVTPADVRDAGEDLTGDDVFRDLPGTDMASDTVEDRAAGDADLDAEEASDGGDNGPGEYIRPEMGEPLTAEEIDAITEKYIEILRKTRYFDVLNERVHGWPRDDPQGRSWYGTWWSGITMKKTDGRVTYLHSLDGADNNGMRTGPMVVGTCMALKLWGNERDVKLARKLVRGFSSWAMAFRSPNHPEWETKQVLSRAAYPESISTMDDGLDLFIDYSLNHPGEDNDACQYVEVSDNAYWGEIWAKNRRSKDDIGHMMIALAMMRECVVGQDETDPEVQGLIGDINEALAIYVSWAAQVDADAWHIATVDKNGTIYYPEDDLGFLWLELWNIECEAAVTLRLFHGGNPDDLNCGNGINPDKVGEEDALKNDFHQIQRSFHESAVMQAWRAGRDDIAREMLGGLAWRLDKRLDELETLSPVEDPHLGDLGELVLMAGNSGLPLTWREVRFLHSRITESYDALVGTQDQATLDARFNVFSPDVPDGTYSFDPGDTGMAWRYIGALLGACASPFWSQYSKPVFDCDKIRNVSL